MKNKKNKFHGFVRKVVVLAGFIAVTACFAVVSYWVSSENHESHVCSALKINDGSTNVAQAFFTPDDDVRSLLISLIHSEKKSISFAIYTFTDKSITQALIRAYERGVKIECVVDKSYGTDRFSRVAQIAQAEIPVWVYQTNADARSMALMHNKFCLFEDNSKGLSLLWTGSYNFTNRASTRNRENVLILNDKNLWNQYKKQFDILKMRSIQISGKIQKDQSSARISESTWLQKLSNFIKQL